MTSPHSSISNSENRLFVRVFGISVVVLLAALGSFTAASYHFGLIDVATRGIYHYQLKKIENADEINIVFVGDSSLGNSIDASRFSELSGKPAVNLALSGTYGLGASFNMIRRTAEEHDVRAAIVVQSLNTMTRPDTVAGYFFTTNQLEWSELSLVEIAKLYFNYRTAKETVQSIRRRGFKRSPAPMHGDYVAQQPQALNLSELKEELGKEPLLPGMVAQSELDFITRIAEYCEEGGILCLYAHGPIYEGYCRSAKPYIESLNQAIADAGLQVVEGTPRCMSLEEVGDTVDHVRPSEQLAFTEWYFNRLRKSLVEAGMAQD